MSEPNYTKRELDAKFSVIQSGLQTIDANIEAGFKGVHLRQDTANGKVAKLIIAVVGIIMLLVGMGFKEVLSVLSIAL